MGASVAGERAQGCGYILRLAVGGTGVDVVVYFASGCVFVEAPAGNPVVFGSNPFGEFGEFDG